MISFNSSWPPTRAAGPPSLARTLVGALLFCLAIGVMVLGAVFGAMLLVIGLVASSIGSLMFAVRRRFGTATSAEVPPHAQTTPANQATHTHRANELGGVVIDVETEIERRD